ncbi:class I SAM-dependent methyltransferase [Edaphobacter flagellatus]|uniref:class I SAM-dependent methyltransferase n=1 Tax=Edaphobacter flagellatus TaxID=1933044 RepID=UPI0021B46C3A|nr:class I SAM-dependent methyltransferase [Edaphobacter flagellatus]
MSGNRQLTWEQAVLWLKSQPDQDALVKACFYDDPLLAAAERFYSSTEWNAIQKLIGSARGRALDIGAGRGISSFALAKDGWDTVALEPDRSQVVGTGAIRRVAAEGGVHIDVVETWGESLPFENGSFDLVHARQVLHHARDLTQLCREIGRVLKPGGMMVATREHVLSHRRDLKEFLNRHPLHALYGGENAFLLKDYLDAMEGAGIKLSKVLNPLSSDINLYPETRNSVKAQIARKLRIPSAAKFVPDSLLSLRGTLMNQPGRLYTFFGHKLDI